jgi:hypothetical protein
MKSSLRSLALTILAVSLAGCGQLGQLGSPPVEVLYRDSLLGQGLIVQVKNTSDAALEEVTVDVRGPEGERRSFTEASVEGFGVLEVGWKRLGGWQIPAGSTVTVRARGYLLPARSEIPAE